MKNVNFISMTLAFISGVNFGCLVTNQNHCGLNQGACGNEFKCSICETENNGCVPVNSILESGCGFNQESTTDFSNSSTSSESSDTNSDNSSSEVIDSTSTSSGSDGISETSSSGNFNTETSISTSVEPEYYCGDGIVNQVDESCDDANDNENDDCVDCKIATCGDGFLFEKEEECDDGNLENTDDCSNTCKRFRVVFVTSQLFDSKIFPQIASLEGVELAHEHCNEIALLNGIKGDFQAWIADNEKFPSQWLGNFDGVYKLIDETTIVVQNGYEGLIGNKLENPISRNEMGLIQKEFVWTGIKNNSMVGNTCNNWSGDSPEQSDGVIGLSTEIDVEWTHVSTIPCNGGKASLYCFEI